MNENYEKSRSLLYEVFKIPRYENADYIKWQYESSPDGGVIQCNEDISTARIGHYAVIPQIYHRQGGERRMALSCNTAVSPNAQRRGLFTKLAKGTYDLCKNERYIDGVLGVANRSSTSGFLNKLNFSFLGALPVIAGTSFFYGQNDVESFEISNNFLNCSYFAKKASLINFSPNSSSWSQKWTLQKLKWRLSAPGAKYAIHFSNQGAMITSVEKVKGISVVVILKIFKNLSDDKVNINKLIIAACNQIKTLFYVYVGFNVVGSISGLNVPRFLTPSPLNLIYLPILESAEDDPTFKLDTFELLDFDAY